MSAIVKGSNPLLRIGHNVIVIGRKRSRPQNISKRPRNIIKVVITTQKKKLTLPVKGIGKPPTVTSAGLASTL
jgi:hypothetical protein